MVHGLTFIAVAHSMASHRLALADDRERAERMERFRGLVTSHREEITNANRETLVDINRQLHQQEPAPSSKTCPECRRLFTIVTVRGIEIDCCRWCRGIWFDPGELQVFSNQSKEIPADDRPNRTSRYDCPVCQTRMTEYVFLEPFGLLVDRCPKGHGVYLEDRELEWLLGIVE